jgi:hypothetical protein
MSLATTDPSAPAYSRNRGGRNRSILPYERHVPANVTIYSNPAARASLALRALNRKRVRAKQRKRFRVQLALFKTDIETTIFDAVVQWALQYAPERIPFGLITDFSRGAFEKLHGFQHELHARHIEKLKEMVWAMQMWAMGEGIDVETLRHNEYMTVEFSETWPPGEEILFDFSKIKWEGCGGILGMFAAMVMYDRGLRAGNHNFTHATTAWREVVLASMERSVESMAINSMAWQSRILALVADRWIMQNEPEDRLIQWNYLNRFLMEDVYE